ncbi:MAG: HyaD/HybD family hydrogenase maturation endopeptidase [Anaerolineae bacterium]
MPGKTLVLGLGNILLRDDGVGVRTVERLGQRGELPPQVEVLDGGTLGMDLLPYLEGVDRLIVVDAVDMGAEPGTVARFQGDEVPSVVGLKVSPHQEGLADLLAAARLCGLYPREVVLWGVQPADVSVGLELSEPVAAVVEALADRVLRELGGAERRRQDPHGIA